MNKTNDIRVVRPIKKTIVAIPMANTMAVQERTIPMNMRSVESWYVIFQTLSVLFVMLTVGTGAGTIITGYIANRRQAEAIGNANTKSADAAAEVAKLQIVVAEAEQKRAEAERALLELQERLKPRHLVERARFVAFLNEHSSGDRPIEVRCSAGDVEARNFALEIDSAIKEAGWQSHLNDHVIIVPQPVGLFFWVHSPDSVPDHAAYIQQAFNEIGLHAEGQTTEDVKQGSLVLIVGSKP